MARVTDPLFSRSASGRIGTALLFRAGKSGPRVSRPPDPRRVNQAPPSTAQAAVRARYSAATSAWRALTPAERAQWNVDARSDPRNIHGWALFLQRFAPLPENDPLPESYGDGINIHAIMPQHPRDYGDGISIHAIMR